MKFFILILMMLNFGCASKQESPTYKEDVRSVIQSSRPKLKSCYNNAAQSDQALEGTLTAKFSINSDGEVTSIDIDQEKSTIKNKILIECVKKEIKGLKFSNISPDVANRDVTFPFVFNNKDEDSFSK